MNSSILAGTSFKPSPSRRKKVSRASLVLAAGALVLAACGGTETAAPEPAPVAPAQPQAPVDVPLTPISVTYGHSVAAINASYALLAVAQQLYFPQEALDVTIQTTGGSLEVVQSVIAGQFDIGITLPEGLIRAIEDGEKIQGVFNVIRKPTGSIAVLKDSPIQAVSDLAGAKLGAQSLGSGNILLTNAQLAEAGVDPNSVTYIAVGGGAPALVALQNGDVDALILFDSLYAGMENLGAEFRYFEPDERVISSGLFVTHKTRDENSEMIERFGRAWAKAIYFTYLNPEAAIRMMWEEFPDTRNPGVSEADQVANDMRVLMRRMDLLIAQDPISSRTMGEFPAGTPEFLIDFLVEFEIIKGTVAPGDVFTNEFVAAFNDFDWAAVEADANSRR